MLFEQIALVIAAIWLGFVAVRWQRSTLVLIGGLCVVGAFALTALAEGQVSAASLGLSIPRSWLLTVGYAVAWLALMLACSPAADWIASRLIEKPPALGAFRAIQQSRLKLVAGIIVAWALGGILEEFVFRGVVLGSVEALLRGEIGVPGAAALAVVAAALGAAVIHLYQGPRAALIIAQLSVLFGILFVVSGHNLYAVMLCHGLYDTVAFIRFANKSSKYSNLEA